MPKLFISHTHADKRLADAFKQLMNTVFSGRVTTVYSSDESESGGIGAGEEWRDWINRAVRDSEVALVLLTPSSVQKPWVLWESGAVFGLYLGAEAAAAPRKPDEARPKSPLRPLVFHLTPGQVPSPFEQLQSLRGDDEKAMMKLVNGFVEEDFASVFEHDKPALFKAGREIEKAVQIYVEEVRLALKDAPPRPDGARRAGVARENRRARQGRPGIRSRTASPMDRHRLWSREGRKGEEAAPD